MNDSQVRPALKMEKQASRFKLRQSSQFRRSINKGGKVAQGIFLNLILQKK